MSRQPSRARVAPVATQRTTSTQAYDLELNAKVLGQVWPVLTLSHRANALVILLTQKVLLHKLKTSGSTTPHSIIEAAHTKIKGDLGMHIVTEVTKAVTRFNNQQQTLLSGNLNLFDQLIGNATAAGIIAMAAAVEYIVAELTELAGGVTRDKGRDVMSEEDIYIAIEADSELRRIFTSKVSTTEITQLSARIVATIV